jgi:hypothetical protein
MAVQGASLSRVNTFGIGLWELLGFFISSAVKMRAVNSMSRCDKDHGVGIKRYMIQIRLHSSSRGEGIVE